MPLTYTLGSGVALFLLALASVTFEFDRTGLWPWLFLGLMGNVTALSYTVVSRHFPLALSGRATTALNLLVFLGAFGVQSAMGGIVDLVAAGETEPYPADRLPSRVRHVPGALLPGVVLVFAGGTARAGHLNPLLPMGGGCRAVDTAGYLLSLAPLFPVEGEGIELAVKGRRAGARAKSGKVESPCS